MKKILLTGSSGFLGTNLYSFLKNKYNIKKLDISNSDYNYDLKKEIPNFKNKFDLVIHAAGKAHSISKNEDEIKDFYDVNYEGTRNLLNSFNLFFPKNFIFISSVSVYGLNLGSLINEKHSLDAKDPYGKSKVLTENLIQKWGKKNNVNILILRLPLLAGKNPPGNLQKMIKAIQNKYFFNISGTSPKKSIVLVDDIVSHIDIFYGKRGIFNLTDGHNPTVEELSFVISKQCKTSKPFKLPYFILKLISSVGDVFPFFPLNSLKLKKLTSELTFDDSKARKLLGWRPNKVINNFKIN